MLVEDNEILLYNQETMKVRLRHVIVADSVIMDSFTNKISAIGIFDVIQIEADKKSRIANFAVTARLIFDELSETDTINVKLQLLKPSGESEKDIDLSLKVTDFPDGTGEKKNVPIVVSFNSVEFTEIGLYKIKITVNGEEPEVSTVGSFEAIKLQNQPK